MILLQPCDPRVFVCLQSSDSIDRNIKYDSFATILNAVPFVSASVYNCRVVACTSMDSINSFAVILNFYSLTACLCVIL